MKGSKVWTFERLKMWTFYIFEHLMAHTYEPNISLIRLMLIMQNPECSCYFRPALNDIAFYDFLLKI